MTAPELLKRHRSFDGWTQIHRHESTTTGTPMRFAVYLPPQAAKQKCPVVWFLSGLTCTEENVITKSGIQEHAARHGVIIVAPDTSPRGDDVPGKDLGWDCGIGAGFYVNARREPFLRNYQMYDYVREELPALVAAHFPVDMTRQGIMGHSMGGHGALVLGLRNPAQYRSVSAFSPICAPSQSPWGQKAFTNFLGEDRALWRDYDATELVARATVRRPLLVDQGAADEFLVTQLKPELFVAACGAYDHPLDLRIREGYDHSYYFIATFMGEHVAHHARALAAGG